MQELREGVTLCKVDIPKLGLSACFSRQRQTHPAYTSSSADNHKPEALSDVVVFKIMGPFWL